MAKPHDYTLEEIEARITLAESEIDAGLEDPSDVVFARMRQIVMNRL